MGRVARNRCPPSNGIGANVTATTPPGPVGSLAWEHERFERVTGELDLDPATICALYCAGRSLIVELPLRRDA